MNATALIAEDEPLLAAHLKVELARLWPELSIVATVWWLNITKSRSGTSCRTALPPASR